MGKDQSKSGGKRDVSSSIITDPRFANIQSDPRYRLPSKKHTHIKLDKRFEHMLHDKEFSRNAAVDRYGRKLRRDDTKRHMEKFYHLQSDEREDGMVVEVSVDYDGAVQKELKRVEKLDYDPARDGGFSASSSDEGNSSEESEEEEEEEDESEVTSYRDMRFPGDKDGDIPVGEVSNRLAIVNLDWDHVRAEDLLAVFSSFLPGGGRIVKVAVYPSEFGRERMDKEEMEGPPKEIFSRRADDAQFDRDDDEDLNDDEDEEAKIKQSIVKEDKGEEFDSARLRKYQLERLRYFYAILTLSSKEIAKHIYDSIDGTELMSSANFFDLRFVPDDTDFTDDVPRDECAKIPENYRPSEFVTDALRHSKVKLTWDADDIGRREVQARAFRGSKKEIDENDLKAYLGSDTSSDEDDSRQDEIVDGTSGDTMGPKQCNKQKQRERVRALLGLNNKSLDQAKSKSSGPVGDMEITFSAGLSAALTREPVLEDETERQETTMERYIRKEKERRKRQKENLKACSTGLTSTDAPAAKNEDAKDAEREDDLGFNDPFFSAPEYNAAAAAAQRKAEKRKVLEQRDAEEEASAAQRAELELLMVDDKASEIKHFDMNDIEKAEKRERKSGKHKKGKKTDSTASNNFKMDVHDPRFQRLFESHEFAIDPTNPKFKGTKGMKAFLEEGRRRRTRQDHDLEDSDSGKVQKKKRKQRDDTSGDKEELNRLVQRVKGRPVRV